jgi:oxygen-independent coproporphyrinogen-3 oxidase
MYNAICDKLKKSAFVHYEVSNFCLPGFESVHNINYWNNGEYYGFGLGASGFKDAFRYTNTRNIHDYIEGKYRLEEKLMTYKEQMDNEIMLGFRKLKGINLDDWFNKYNCNIQDHYPVKELLKTKELIYKDGYLFVNPEKIYVMNEILVKLL